MVKLAESLHYGELNANNLIVVVALIEELKKKLPALEGELKAMRTYKDSAMSGKTFKSYGGPNVQELCEKMGAAKTDVDNLSKNIVKLQAALQAATH